MGFSSMIDRGSLRAKANHRRTVASSPGPFSLAIAPASARTPPWRSASISAAITMKPCTAVARHGSSPQISSARRCSSVGKPSPASRATATIARATSPGFSGWRPPAAQARAERSASPIFRATAVGPTTTRAGLILLLPIRRRRALTGTDLFGLRNRKCVARIIAPNGCLLQDQPPFAVANRATPENAAGVGAAARSVERQHFGDRVAGVSGETVLQRPEPPPPPSLSGRSSGTACHSRQIANREPAKSRDRVQTERPLRRSSAPRSLGL